MKLTKKEKETIRLALYLAIDHEDSYLDSLGDPDDMIDREWVGSLKDIIKRTKKNIANFDQLLTRFKD